MKNKLPLAVIVLTYNEERNIEKCIKSVYGWVDEIFVVDSFSTDKTVEIARLYTDKIYQHRFENFAQQRNWAQANVPSRNEWVFHLDADERVSSELALELKNFFSAPDSADGLMFPRKIVFRGKWLKYGDMYPVYHLRIFKKSKGKSEERLYDQNYLVKGRVIKLKGSIINIINSDLDSWRIRHRRWSVMEAREILLNKKRTMNISFAGNPIERKNWLRYKVYYNLPLFIRVPIYFFYRYILRLGFLDGKEGAVFHFYHGFWYRLCVDAEIAKLYGSK